MLVASPAVSRTFLSALAITLSAIILISNCAAQDNSFAGATATGHFLASGPEDESLVPVTRWIRGTLRDRWRGPGWKPDASTAGGLVAVDLECLGA